MRRAGIALVCLLTVATPEVGAQGEPPIVTMTDLSRYSFAVVGQSPYGPDAASTWTRTTRGIQSTDVRFIVHAGDFKSAEEPCSDAILSERLALLDSTALPLIYVVGGNDWVGCGAPAAGRFDPTERLARLRELFFVGPESLGRERLALARQSDLPRFRGFPENLRWQVGSVMFVALNLPEGNDDFRLGAGRNGEFEDRTVANKFWLERAFHLAKLHKLDGVVVIVAADPQFALGIRPPDRRNSRRDGYFEFKSVLRDQVNGFRGPVLLLHQSGPGFREDQPLTDAAGKVMRNLLRVETFGAASSGNWVRVDVDPAKRPVFTATAMPAAVMDDELPSHREP